MIRTHLIPNPRYDRYDSTRIRCGDGIYNIVFNWSPNQLVKIDDLLNGHAFITAHEQIVHQACTNHSVYRRAIQRDGETGECDEPLLSGDETKVDEYRALKKTRAKLVKTLLSTFKKVEQKIDLKIH